MWLKHTLLRQHLQVGNWVSKWPFVCLASMVASFTQSRCCPLCLTFSPNIMQSWLSGYWFRIKKSVLPQTHCVNWSKSFVSLWRQLGEISKFLYLSGYPNSLVQDTNTHSSSYLCCTSAKQKSGHSSRKKPWYALSKWLTLLAPTAKETGFPIYEKNPLIVFIKPLK